MNIKQTSTIIKIFAEDQDLHKYCDPDFILDNNKISFNIIKRLSECLKNYPDSYLYINNEYKYFALWLYAFDRNILYSFGMHPNYRSKENLINFWNYIINQHNDFDCYLYSNNTRAINWLKKCGMKEEGFIPERKDKVAIKLFYKNNN